MSLVLDGESILVPETAKVINGSSRLRGGMPLLFPQAGLLEEGPYPLPNHGFARNMPWNIIESSESKAVLGLDSTPETVAIYPFDFSLRLEIELYAQGMRYDLFVSNHSKEAMPVAPGLHPYFNIPLSDRPDLITTLSDFEPTTFTGPSTLMFSNQGEVALEWKGKKLGVEASPSFRQWAVWTEPSTDYLCIEPWTGDPGALIDPKQAHMIAPTDSLQFSLELKLSRTNS